MILQYDPDDLLDRRKTELKDKDDNTLFWGVYDFAYKYRTRIFDGNDRELGYVQLDVGKPVPEVVFSDAQDRTLGGMIKENGRYLVLPEEKALTGNCLEGDIPGVMKIEKGRLDIDEAADPLRCVMILFASVEIKRGEEET